MRRGLLPEECPGLFHQGAGHIPQLPAKLGIDRGSRGGRQERQKGSKHSGSVPEPADPAALVNGPGNVERPLSGVAAPRVVQGFPNRALEHEHAPRRSGNGEPGRKAGVGNTGRSRHSSLLGPGLFEPPGFERHADLYPANARAVWRLGQGFAKTAFPEKGPTGRQGK
jgi:hypothetical protein